MSCIAERKLSNLSAATTGRNSEIGADSFNIWDTTTTLTYSLSSGRSRLRILLAQANESLYHCAHRSDF